MKFVSFLISIACLATFAPTGKAQVTPPDDLDVYLLMGQSNMSGRGAMEELPSNLRHLSPDIWLYSNDGKWRAAAEPLDDATGQLDTVSSDGQLAGVGPGLAFARSLQMKNRRGIALVQCAKGGSSLLQWAINNDRSHLYGSCLARANEAKAHGRIAGVLWYQGETDAENIEAARAWSGHMVTLIRQLRGDLNDHCLPWVVVGLSDRPSADQWPRPTDGWLVVQTAQAELPTHVRRLIHVSAAGLPHNSDGVHLSTAAQLTLGSELANGMLAVQNQPCLDADD